MAKDFSQVGSGSGPSYATGSPSSGSASGLPMWVKLAIGFSVLVLIVGIIAVFTSGSDDDSNSGADAIRAAHGPTTTIDGVPAGYTRDQAGAQTAAVNFIQANGQTYQGRIDAARLREVAVSASATDALNAVIDVSSGRTDLGKTVNNVPLIVTVTDFSQDSATVSVWGMGVGQSPVSEGSDKVGILTVYSTSTVTMKWENGDWKAQDWKFVSGPSAEDAQFPAADSPLSKPGANGFYTFYVN
ncbi:hypothetical protein [Rhodococcus sp. (in: high G+C Gram-positive bacteria)]|uniref:hypothetical protein n=1 Tax=Rhodococcus sp. TaxID=1831 RepID=UPI00257CAFD5|nr:hypothetical protein [Rhodococcus sp. (in: high G+C Gram-positive bacteria)]MBQ7805059.1 hypothetical protein [Rhodococcus sp. (in: high G+C Gram-positive bacteria)]